MRLGSTEPGTHSDSVPIEESATFPTMPRPHHPTGPRATLANLLNLANLANLAKPAMATMAALVMLTACAEDDPVGMFPRGQALAAEQAGEAEQAGQAEGADSGSGDPTDSAAATEEIEIPEDALDLTGQATVDIEIEDNVFIQQVVLVSPGTTITWANEGRNEHNVQPTEEDAFEAIPTADLAEKGMSASLTFDSPGDYPYFCSLHGPATRGQTGRVIVVP